MKKIIAALTFLCVAASAVSCGAKEDDTELSKPDQPATAAKTTEAETEAETETETETEEPTLSAEEIQKIKDEDMKYLEKFEVSLLDYYVGTPEEAGIDSDDSDKATILTVGVNYNSTDLKKLDWYDLMAKDVSLRPNQVSTVWGAKDKDGELWGLYRFRFEGEYPLEDLKLQFCYDDEYNVTRDVGFGTEGDFETFAENMCWYEDSDSEEAVDGKIKHPYIYKIHDRYCIIDSYHETPPHGNDSDNELDYYDQTYAITPLEGAFGPVLAEGDVELESENVKPYTYSKLIGLRNSNLGQYVTCYICCKWDGVLDWDNMSDEDKMGALNAQALINKVIPMQSQSTYLIIHAGEGEDIKYSCAISE